MNFNLSRKESSLLILLTVGIGFMQVMTPLFLRILIDGIMPSKDGLAIGTVLVILGLNELLLVAGNSLLNRELDRLENDHIHSLRKWMLDEVSKFTARLKNAEGFYQAWSQDSKRLVYKRVKNPWYRAKDLIILILLSFICVNISYMAGGLVIAISAVTFFLVNYYQENQSADIKSFHQKAPIERKLFDEVLTNDKLTFDEKKDKLVHLQTLSGELNELHFRLAHERTRFQDINNSIRFIMMFSILGIGGHLFATEKLSMGSLWALLITMYRITSPVQSLARWLLQSRSDDNLEKRIQENMETEIGFKKPEFYNRLVKMIEKHLAQGSTQIILVDNEIEMSSVLKSLNAWKSFYSKKDQIVISEGLPNEFTDGQFYFVMALPDQAIRERGLYFGHREDFTSLEGFEVVKLGTK